jgi:WXG100 family type VII secretion target
MGANYQAELGTMQAAAQHVQDVNDQIQGQLASLLSRLEPLQSGWKGTGANSFQSLIQRWHEDATQLNSVLHSIGERLAQTHANITSAEGDVGQSFNTIQGRLG